MDYYSKLIISEDFNKLIEELQKSNINFSKDEITAPISINTPDYTGSGKRYDYKRLLRKNISMA